VKPIPARVASPKTSARARSGLSRARVKRAARYVPRKMPRIDLAGDETDDDPQRFGIGEHVHESAGGKEREQRDRDTGGDRVQQVRDAGGRHGVLSLVTGGAQDQVHGDAGDGRPGCQRSADSDRDHAGRAAGACRHCPEAAKGGATCGIAHSYHDTPPLSHDACHTTDGDLPEGQRP
jgi:hypothetical protein